MDGPVGASGPAGPKGDRVSFYYGFHDFCCCFSLSYEGRMRVKTDVVDYIVL